MKAFEFQPGPMARRVEDLELGLKAISTNVAASDAPATQIGDYQKVDLSRLRIGVWPDDNLFPVSPGIRRAIQEAAKSLETAGARIESFTAPRFAEAIDLYMGLMSSDGGIGLRSIANGSKVDAGIKQLFRIGRIPRSVRPAMAVALRAVGQTRMARLLLTTGARSAADFWNLTRQRTDYEAEFLKAMDKLELDAIIFPPYALAAIKHQTATDLLMAGCYAYVTNLVGLPAGIASLTRVRNGEESDRGVTRDLADRLAAESESGSVGLPIGIQVAARHWREDVVLAIMSHLEAAFQNRPDYPRLPLKI
jgi:fatty acid amide hydrolase